MHKRCFLGVGFVRVKEIVKLGVAAAVHTHAVNFVWLASARPEMVSAICWIVFSDKLGLDGK